MATAQSGGREPFFIDDPALLDDPYAAFARYRAESPVYHHAPVDQWFVFRHGDVSDLFRDPRLSADRMKGFVDQAPEAVRPELRAIVPLFESWTIMKDGPEHTRLRHALNQGFNATAVKALAPLIEASANQLIDERVRDGRFDVADDYGFRLPAHILSDFLGVHVEDRDKIIEWSVDFVDFFNEIPITEATTHRLSRSVSAMNDYTMDLINERRRSPKNDFLGTLLASADTPGGLSDTEIVGNAILLLLAGHIAVRNMIGNIFFLLDGLPEARAQLDANPALLEPMVDEALRFEAPVTLIPRVALEPIEVAGITIPEGALVQLSIASANRDETQFPDPDRFDIARRPGHILSFGRGPHGCAGAHLARMQGAIATRVLLARYPAIRRDEDKPIVWYRTAANRGPINLPMRVD
ncbi:cytochrome P450 [Acuticoccus kandeliae]|uniref:cytochrome P450 n=1 Tax=Acuticoccus kandeliae TaxID=2073160 RepID=UPI000D3E8C67|nr:cytochrome P450 [Acuticoccus kandeliae]